MKKRALLAVAGAAATAGLAGFLVIYGTVLEPWRGAQFGDGIALGASLDTGPVPIVDSAYDLSAHQTLSRVIFLIRESYVDPDRIKPYDMFISALSNIERTVPEVIIDNSQAPRRVKVTVGEEEQIFDLGGLDQLWEVTMALRDIFRFLQQKIVDTEQRREIEYAAINGMLATLDPHSILLKPESFDEVKLSTKGEFGGLGIVISIRDGTLTIISPIAGTPASRAGLRAQDKIVKIGEESTINMGLEEAVQRLRGKPGTKIVVWIMRKGWTESRRFQLTRAIIKIESVSSKLLEAGVGYIRIKSFQNNTYDDLRSHLETLRKDNHGQIKGLILDLRNNPGGLLDQAIHVSDRFIDRGPIVITVGEGNRRREVKQARFSGTEPAYPIVTLVNGGSASASEIVSGAFKNLDRAVVIGQQTFGKGSVQVLYDFKDRSALKLTIAQYLTPGDISIQSVGITPHIEIVPVTASADAIHIFADNGAPREKDLDKHLSQHGGGDAEQAEQAEKPNIRVTHFIPLEEIEGAEGANEDDFQYDFEIELAHGILAQSNTSSAAGIMKGSTALVEKHITQQEERVASELTKLGVDWTVAPRSGSPSATVTLTAAGAASTTVPAGETMRLTATVTNPGDAPLYRVYGVTESDNPLLHHLEFVFGRVDPGQSRSWEVGVKIPADISSRGDRVSITLGDLYDETAGASAAMFVTMHSREKPRLAFTTFIVDTAGNGDGLLQLGEEVGLKVEVANLGPGRAEEVVVTVKNLSGEAVFLARGRDGVGEIDIGSSKTAMLNFTVRQPVDSVSLRLLIWDDRVGAAVTEKLVMPVTAKRKRHADLRGLKVSKEPIPVYAGADREAQILGYAKGGAILRTDAVFGDWRRVEIAPGQPGFVREEDIQVLRGNLRRQSPEAITRVSGSAAPVIKVTEPIFVTQEESLLFKASIEDEAPPKDVFVFVNDKKVFYRTLASYQSSATGGFAMPIELALPLKEGANAIAVVVRENDDLVARRVFGVYRDHHTVMAERVGEARPPHP